MTNYGHPIRFGVEISGAPDGPGEVAEVAIRAERLGYDLVSVTEQLDEGAGADAWSLATWVAARTNRIQVAPGVQPGQRPASVLARSAASLQLLTEGRATLVLEAGRGDTAVLEDTVAVLAAMQDTTQPRVSRTGVHHRVENAEPGPVVERAVPLWLREVSTRADSAVAGLAGRAADGWITDLTDLADLADLASDGAADLAELNKAVDEAAVEAGRDPREVRRVVTLSGADLVGGEHSDDAPGGVDSGDAPDGADSATVAALVALVVDHGVSTFVLRVAAENAAQPTTHLERFINDIAPAVRAGAERALPPGALSSRPMRRADVRARRQPAIAYDEVPTELAERAVEPGDPAYAKVRSTYLRGGNPGLVLRPTTVEEVASAVAFAHTHRHLPLGIRSGGHGISGRSTNEGGLVIDVGALAEIAVIDEARRLVRIGPGARWRDVAKVLQPHGWALSSGDYGGVGVGGLATAGGIGFLNRKHGLTIDHLHAVEMVLADGSHVRATEAEHPELFWAARGAGANFGIATAFEFTVDEVDNVGWAQLAFQAPDPAAYLKAFGQVATSTPRETTPFLVLGQGMAQLMAMVDSADPDVVISQLQPYAEIAPLVQQQVVIAPYAAVMNMFPETPHNGRGEPVSRSALVREITPGFASASADLIQSRAAHWFQIRTVGGAVADVAPDATAYAHRDANFSLTVMGANAQRLDQWFEPVRRQSDGLYLSFESDRSPERITDAFPPVTLERLRRLKAELDPHNLFQDNFNIAPTHSEAATDTRSA